MSCIMMMNKLIFLKVCRKYENMDRLFNGVLKESFCVFIANCNHMFPSRVTYAFAVILYLLYVYVMGKNNARDGKMLLRFVELATHMH